MGKLIVALLATCGAILVLWLVVGPTLADTAFHVSGRGVSWTLVAGAVFGYAIWRVIKGK